MGGKMLLASKILAWVAIGLSIAVVLAWFLLFVTVELWTGGSSEDAFVAVLMRSAFFGGWLLAGVHFLPLYGATAFLWFAARGRLRLEERRGIRLAMCVGGGLLSAGGVLWYAREAILLFGGNWI
ncbi:MAG: hypothetical protein J1E00_07530 [Oscillospiraceae bacterium]|nr:hypothetical protein [Oscillospiraceae bacterium]